MDINKLTIGEARELMEQGREIAKVLGHPEPEIASNSPFIGKFVIVRCRDAGVHAGVLESAHGRSCVLSESRRLFSYLVPMGASEFLSGVALSGIVDESKLGAPITVQLTENCEIIACSEVSEKSIREFPIWKRTKQ